MKHLRILTLVLISLVGCQKDAIDINEELTDPGLLQPSTETKGGTAYPSDQMIIQFQSFMTPAQKQNLRDQYGVTSYKTCECADPNLELWIFSGTDNGMGTIEERVHTAKGNSGVEGADFNPKIIHGGTAFQPSFGQGDLSVGQSMTVTNNQNVTIAVLDTGVDYSYFGFDQPFLYNSAYNDYACDDYGMQDYFGWDFVNQDNDPYDNHGHGTSISYIIAETLLENNVDFQILPVKVFDGNGQGSYFDILCGFKYAVNNQDVDIINMSFGWYEYEYELLYRFIEGSKEKVLVTTSAGNSGINTDQMPHYPSAYPTSNIIATAALQGNPMNVALAQFSNYGPNSVDVASLGENIPFYITPNEYIMLSGTSYSNAYMSAHAAVAYDQGMTVELHVEATVFSTIYHNNLSMLKYSSYVYY